MISEAGTSGLTLVRKSTEASLHRVLLCTDFSGLSRAAMQTAAAICTASQAALTVLHVSAFDVAPTATEDLLEGLVATRRQQQQSLQQELHYAHSLGVDATSALVTGNTHEEILKQIEAVAADIVVIGTQGARGLERFIFGSTAEALYRTATCPVVTVGPQSKGGKHTSPGPAIVFATDFHEPALQAARHAIHFANMYGAELHSVHVLPENITTESPAITSIMAHAMQALTHEAGHCEARQVFNVLHGSEVSTAVVDYARSVGAEMIVLGARSKLPYLAHLPPGITHKIVLQAPCPVITVRHDPTSAPAC